MAWLFNFLGMAGASGLFCCLFCWVSRRHLQAGFPHAAGPFPRAVDTKWTSEQTRHQLENGNSATFAPLRASFPEKTVEDLEKYYKAGAAAKEKNQPDSSDTHRNCVFPHLLPQGFDIQRQIARMVLHWNLGLGAKFFALLEEQCEQLDDEIKRRHGEVNGVYNATELQVESIDGPIAPRDVLLELYRRHDDIGTRGVDAAFELAEVDLDLRKVTDEIFELNQPARTGTQQAKNDEQIVVLQQRHRGIMKGRRELMAKQAKDKKQDDKELKTVEEAIKGAPGPFKRRLAEVMYKIGVARAAYHNAVWKYGPCNIYAPRRVLGCSQGNSMLAWRRNVKDIPKRRHAAFYATALQQVPVHSITCKCQPPTLPT